jgi:hypothetical protein
VLLLLLDLYNFIANGTVEHATEFIVTATAIILLFFTVAYAKRVIYYDLRSPVFGTTGILKSKGYKFDDTQVFKVRNIYIASKNLNANLYEYVSNMKKGTKVYIEYSPHSGRLWKLIPVQSE